MTYRTLEGIRHEIDRYRQPGPNFKTWRAITALPQFHGVSFATLRAVYYGREPQTPDVRRALGLPVTVPVAVCENCGMPHLRKTCPNRAKPPRQPRYRPTVREVRGYAALVLALLIGDPR